jgi:hypothetical protein
MHHKETKFTKIFKRKLYELCVFVVQKIIYFLTNFDKSLHLPNVVHTFQRNYAY